MWAHIRTLRIADGPDEVHLQQLGRRENRTRKDEVVDKRQWQSCEADRDCFLQTAFEPNLTSSRL